MRCTLLPVASTRQTPLLDSTPDQAGSGFIRSEKAEQAFQAERSSGIGGSDAQHYLNLDPYGCRRMCWYQKRGCPPDYPVTGSEDVFERGHALEPIILEKLHRETGRGVAPAPGLIRHPEHPELIAHIDGRDERGWVVEAKTMNREVWYKAKREGIPVGYQVQAQHYCMVTGAPGATFAVLWPDGWKFASFDVERDDEAIAILKPQALGLWAQVQSGAEPNRLDPKCRQCAKCQWRTTCQGAALLELAGSEVSMEDDSMGDLVTEFFEMQEIADEALALFDAVRDRIRESMGDRLIVDAPGGRIHYRPVTTNRLDTKALGKDHPEIVAKYKKPSVSRPLRVFPR